MPPFTPSKHTVRASAVLTTSYVAGTVFSMDRQNYLGILVDFTKGSLTSLEVKIESSIDGGANYGQQATEATSGGTITTSLGERTFTATGKYWIIVNPLLADTIKISVKGTGTVTSSLCAVSAVTGTV